MIAHPPAAGADLPERQSQPVAARTVAVPPGTGALSTTALLARGVVVIVAQVKEPDEPDEQ